MCCLPDLIDDSKIPATGKQQQAACERRTSKSEDENLSEERKGKESREVRRGEERRGEERTPRDTTSANTRQTRKQHGSVHV